MYIVIAGNPVDGFNHFGPFDTPAEANDWADHLKVDWWVADLHQED